MLCGNDSGDCNQRHTHAIQAIVVYAIHGFGFLVQLL